MRLQGFNDVLVEYVLSEMELFSDLDYTQQQKLKSIKLSIRESGLNNYEICVGMGMAEAIFDFNGNKKSGSLGANVERLVKHWLSRPLNQEALKSLLEK